MINPRVVLDCQHADTCLPGYWCGHHLPHLQIPVHRGMTLREIKKALVDEVIQGAFMGATDDVRLLTADWVPERDVARANNLNKAVHAAIQRIKPAVKGTRTFFKDLEDGDEDSPTVYAYFVFVDITPEHMRRMYWLCEECEDPVPYATKAAAIAAFRKVAEELAQYAQAHSASLHIAETADDISEYPDFVLSTEYPHFGVQVTKG